jgi:hypothetical protein
MTISKRNGVAWASIAKASGVAVADIAKVDGVDAPAGYSFGPGNTSNPANGTLTWAHTCAAGANALYFAAIVRGTSTDPTVTATYNGVSATAIKSATLGAGKNTTIKIFMIDDNAVTFDTSAHNIVVSSSQLSESICFALDIIENDIDGTPYGSIASVESSGTRNNLDVSCATGDIAFAMCALDDPDAMTAQDSQTEIYNTTTSNRAGAGGYLEGPSTTQSMDWTWSTTDAIRSYGFAIKPKP